MTGNFLADRRPPKVAVRRRWSGRFTGAHIPPLRSALVGLVLAIPVVCLSLPAGHLADKYSRKHIIMIAQVVSARSRLPRLAIVSWKHLAFRRGRFYSTATIYCAGFAGIFERHQSTFHFDDFSVPLIYLLLFVSGTARTFAWAARSSFFPTLVPRDAFANACTWNNSVFQIGSVAGLPYSGFIVAHISFSCVYVIDAICSFLFFLLVLPIPRAPAREKREEQNTWRSLQAGNAFCSEQTRYSRNHHARLVRGFTGRRDRLIADVCRPNSARWRDWARLDARPCQPSVHSVRHCWLLIFRR
jgi:MFS family permease